MIIKAVMLAGTELIADTPAYSDPIDLNSTDWTRDAQGYGSLEIALQAGQVVSVAVQGSNTGENWTTFGYDNFDDSESVHALTIPPCAKIRLGFMSDGVNLTLPDCVLCII